LIPALFSLENSPLMSVVYVVAVVLDSVVVVVGSTLVVVDSIVVEVGPIVEVLVAGATTIIRHKYIEIDINFEE
ncbi:hypothetical protein AVEN_205738-1, partial [Araneus ventricosus]